MAIKAGTFIHDVHGFVIDRIQTGGVSSLNIPQEKIYELGNYNSVAIVRDIPDLTFDIESFDVSTEVEALIHGIAPSNVLDGNEFTFNTTFPLDVISPFKAGNGAFNIVKGIVVPYLSLDTVDYKFGVKANASEKFTLRGDSVYYVPGSPYYQEFTLVNNTLTYTLAHTALPYLENGNTIHVLGACVRDVTTGIYKRLFFGTDANGYTDTGTTITTQTDWFDTGYTKLHVVYGSATAATYNATVHEGTSVKPAAVRSKDILVYVGTAGSTSALVKWGGVQSVDIQRKVNLQNDEEFGNNHYVSTDYDTSDVTGSIVVRAADTAALWVLIEQITGTDTSHVSGPITTTTNELVVKIRDPDTGTILKTFAVPDARFTLPAASGKIQTKLDVTFQFQSDQGLLSVFRGDV